MTSPVIVRSAHHNASPSDIDGSRQTHTRSVERGAFDGSAVYWCGRIVHGGRLSRVRALCLDGKSGSQKLSRSNLLGGILKALRSPFPRIHLRQKSLRGLSDLLHLLRSLLADGPTIARNSKHEVHRNQASGTPSHE